MEPWREQLATLQWNAPWFEPWRGSGEPVASQAATGLAMHAVLNSLGCAGMRFAAPQDLPAGTAYEQHIFDTGTCPTRDNLHDFFNGLAWLELPRTKRQLNELQAMQIAAHGVTTERGPVRDAITVFDENGAVLSAPQPLWDALAARDWRRLFVELRPLWSQARLLIVGHALLEKLAQPRKNLTAHVWNVSCPGGSMAQVDGWLAGQLSAGRLAAKPFLPLPVLGVPGWWPQNAEFSFYDDPLVFRPAARPESITKKLPADSRRP